MECTLYTVSVDCSLKFPVAKFSAIIKGISTSSLSRQRFNENRKEFYIMNIINELVKPIT